MWWVGALSGCLRRFKGPAVCVLKGQREIDALEENSPCLVFPPPPKLWFEQLLPHERTHELTHELKNERAHSRTHELKNERTHSRPNGRAHERTSELTHSQSNERTSSKENSRTRSLTHERPSERTNERSTARRILSSLRPPRSLFQHNFSAAT